MREIPGFLAGIFLHRERHRLGRARQACTQAGGDSTAKKGPQDIAAINCIHCFFSLPDVPLLASSVRIRST
jgi:hypothetical protein